MARNNTTWYSSDGRGGYRHVSELPAGHVLVDNECACLRPAASKADQTAQHFGNQLVYLSVIHSDANNAALALAKPERSSMVLGTARKENPLLIGDAHGGALTCDRTDRIFAALAFAALDPDPDVAAKRPFHSFRIFAACCHRANNEDDATIQALCRWRNAASLKIYARTNPRDYVACVRRMSATHVDPTIAANLPALDDSALHADFAQVAGPLERGRDISQTCPVYESDDDEDAGVDTGGAAQTPARPRPRAPQQRQPRAHRRHVRRLLKRVSASVALQRRRQRRYDRPTANATRRQPPSRCSNTTRSVRIRQATGATGTTSARERATNSSRSAALQPTSTRTPASVSSSLADHGGLSRGKLQRGSSKQRSPSDRRPPWLGALAPPPFGPNGRKSTGFTGLKPSLL